MMDEFSITVQEMTDPPGREPRVIVAFCNERKKCGWGTTPLEAIAECLRRLEALTDSELEIARDLKNVGINRALR